MTTKFMQIRLEDQVEPIFQYETREMQVSVQRKVKTPIINDDGEQEIVEQLIMVEETQSVEVMVGHTDKPIKAIVVTRGNTDGSETTQQPYKSEAFEAFSADVGLPMAQAWAAQAGWDVSELF